jgi:hypothetical protein
MIVQADLGISNERGQGFHIGPSLLSGVAYQATNWMKLSTSIYTGHFFSSDAVNRLRQETTAAFFFSKAIEGRVFWETFNSGTPHLSHQFGTALFAYF